MSKEALPLVARREPSQESDCKFLKICSTLVKLPITLAANPLVKLPVALIANTFASAGATYATLGLVAIVYKDGLWLMIPVWTGGAIGLTDAMVKILAKKYPDNEFIQALKNKTFVANKICIAYLGDLGFTFSMLRTVGQFITEEKYLQYFKTITFPAFMALSFIPAAMIRTLKVKDEKGISERSITRHAASFFRGATATTGFFSLFQSQGLLGPMIPSIAIAVGGIMGLISSLIKEGSPKVALSLMMLINLAGENPSLIATVFGMVNNMLAGIAEARYENGKIPASERGVDEEAFYTNLVFCILLLGGLSAMSLEKLFTPEESEDEVLVEVLEDEGEDQELSFSV